jgi:hypothetical protein
LNAAVPLAAPGTGLRFPYHSNAASNVNRPASAINAVDRRGNLVYTQATLRD